MAKLQEGSRFDIQLVQGATFSERFNWKDSAQASISLAGYTARMHIRTEPSASASLIDLTTENERITLNSPNVGDISLTISSTDTAALTFNTGVYDLELVHVDGGATIVDNILWGNVSLRKNVTR